MSIISGAGSLTYVLGARLKAYCTCGSMFFLVTGASGVGKSTIRQLIEPEFAGVLEAAELAMLGDTPEWNIAWRHRMVDQMVRHALDVQRGGKHFLFCGDPVPPGEVWAAPSAHQLNHLAVCLLDASERAQTAPSCGARGGF